MDAKMNISQIIVALANNELVGCDLINPNDPTDTFAVILTHAPGGLTGILRVHEPKTMIELFSLRLDEAEQPLKFTYIANSANYWHRAN